MITFYVDYRIANSQYNSPENVDTIVTIVSVQYVSNGNNPALSATTCRDKNGKIFHITKDGVWYAGESFYHTIHQEYLEIFLPIFLFSILFLFIFFCIVY